MTRQQLYEFVRTKRYAVVSTVTPAGQPEAALVGIAVTPELELIFDTLQSARKWANLRANPQVAVVIGWDSEVTVQLEGVAQAPVGAEFERRKAQYFAAWPDGRQRESWPGIAWIVVTPRWARYCNYGVPGGIAEFVF